MYPIPITYIHSSSYFPLKILAIIFKNLRKYFTSILFHPLIGLISEFPDLDTKMRKLIPNNYFSEKFACDINTIKHMSEFDISYVFDLMKMIRD